MPRDVPPALRGRADGLRSCTRRPPDPRTARAPYQRRGRWRRRRASRGPRGRVRPARGRSSGNSPSARAGPRSWRGASSLPPGLRRTCSRNPHVRPYFRRDLSDVRSRAPSLHVRVPPRGPAGPTLLREGSLPRRCPRAEGGEAGRASPAGCRGIRGCVPQRRRRVGPVSHGGTPRGVSPTCGRRPSRYGRPASGRGRVRRGCPCGPSSPWRGSWRATWSLAPDRAPRTSLYSESSLLALPLDGPRRQPGDDAALEDQDHYHQRHRDDHRRCGLCPVVHRVYRGEVRNHDRHRLGAFVKEERVGEQELVPGVDERQDRRREYPGCRKRHDDFAERLYRRRAVYPGRVLEIDGQLLEERHQQPDRQRQREDRVSDDHRRVGVYEAQLGVLDKERGDDRHSGEEADREYQGHHGALEPEPHPEDRVGRYGAEQKAQARRHPGDYRAVYERFLERRVAQDLGPLGTADVLWHQRWWRGVELGLGDDAHLEHPKEREYAHENEDHEEDVEEHHVEGTTPRALTGRCCASHLYHSSTEVCIPRTLMKKSAMRNAVTNMKTAAALPGPNWSWLILTPS